MPHLPLRTPAKKITHMIIPRTPQKQAWARSCPMSFRHFWHLGQRIAASGITWAHHSHFRVACAPLSATGVGAPSAGLPLPLSYRPCGARAPQLGQNRASSGTLWPQFEQCTPDLPFGLPNTLNIDPAPPSGQGRCTALRTGGSQFCPHRSTPVAASGRSRTRALQGRYPRSRRRRRPRHAFVARRGSRSSVTPLRSLAGRVASRAGGAPAAKRLRRFSGCDIMVTRVTT